MKCNRQLNSDFHQPYDQGINDHLLHGNFSLSCILVKNSSSRLSRQSMSIQWYS